jgi:hypothetical protein
MSVLRNYQESSRKAQNKQEISDEDSFKKQIVLLCDEIQSMTVTSYAKLGLLIESHWHLTQRK